jgi:aryl-alcohol dehydrogenase-like predicted oxidoreductase
MKNRIGLGTFPFSNVFGKIINSEAEKIVQTFLDKGGEYIQTSPYYIGVEPLLGNILKRIPRDAYYLATLCVKDKDSQISGKKEAIFSQCNESLSRLGLEYIDLCMTSTPEATDAPFSETIEAMVELQKKGKIREIGVCNVTLAQLKEYNLNGNITYVQNRFSILDQEQDREVREYCARNNIGLIPYNVIEWGLLTNKILDNWILAEEDLRKKVLPVFNEEKVQIIQNWVITYLKPIAAKNNTSIESLAIHWVLSQPSVFVIPVGATKIEQIESSLKTNELEGRTDITEEMNKAYKGLQSAIKSKYTMDLNDFLKNSYGRW